MDVHQLLWFKMNARTLQNIQLVVGRANQVFPVAIGIYIGKNDWFIASILFIVFCIFSAISSELLFEIIETTQKENLIILYRKLRSLILKE